MRLVKRLGWFLSASVLAACGGSSSTGLQNGDAGDGSVGTGGQSGTGGSPGGSGGQTGTGGALATGGALGSGGAVGTDGGGCEAPVNPADTAVCVKLVPEKITPRKADPALDGKGALLVQIFDNAHPPDKNAKPIVERALPLIPTNELSIDALPTVRLVGVMPATVYVRAAFVDNPALLQAGAPISYGEWFGGIDLKNGFQANEPVLPQQVEAGKGNDVALDLVALRKLTVTVHTSATPIGDGQGPLTVIAVDSKDLSKQAAGFGYAKASCIDVTHGNVTVTGFVAGTGPYWVTGVLNDLGLTGDLPEGSLAALTFANGKFTIPQELDIAPPDYAPTIAINLGYVVPLSSDAGPIGPNSCADLASADGGTDAGP